jgi:hypothetical protein
MKQTGIVWSCCVRRAIRKVLLGAAGAAALTYAGDFLSLTLQIPKRPKFGTVHMQPYITVPRKDGRMEFLLDEPFEQTCVHALFPHSGASPCWYLERERSRRKNL